MASKSAFFNGADTRWRIVAKTRWRVVMASFSFSMRFRSSALSRSTCCGEGVLGWWMRQAGSAQTLTTCPRLPPSMTIASAIFSQGFWLAGSLVLAPFAFGFLISNSTYRFRPKGAPSREFRRLTAPPCAPSLANYETNVFYWPAKAQFKPLEGYPKCPHPANATKQCDRVRFLV